MNIDWNAVAAVGGLFSVAIALTALVIQRRKAEIALQTDLLLRYYDRFYSPEMHKLRQAAAQQLIAGQVPNYELEDVLDYFGIIGALVERKALDQKLVRGLFDWWILRYWTCAQDYIRARRQDASDPDPEMWAYLDRLVAAILAYRQKKGTPPVPACALSRFLQEEARAAR